MFILSLVFFLIPPNITLWLLPPVNFTIYYLHSVEKTHVVEKLEVRHTGVYLIYADYGGACGYGIPCGVEDKMDKDRCLGRFIVMYCDSINRCVVETPLGTISVVGTFLVGVVKLGLLGAYG